MPSGSRPLDEGESVIGDAPMYWVDPSPCRGRRVVPAPSIRELFSALSRRAIGRVVIPMTAARRRITVPGLPGIKVAGRNGHSVARTGLFRHVGAAPARRHYRSRPVRQRNRSLPRRRETGRVVPTVIHRIGVRADAAGQDRIKTAVCIATAIGCELRRWRRDLRAPPPPRAPRRPSQVALISACKCARGWLARRESYLDPAPTPSHPSSSFRSIATTGTRSSRPTLIVGMSPRAAASYEAFLDRSKYLLPASGTLRVFASGMELASRPSPICFRTDVLALYGTICGSNLHGTTYGVKNQLRF